MNLKIRQNSNKDKQPALDLSMCLAKTFSDNNGAKTGGHDLLSHCTIVGLVAREMRSRLPKNIKDKYLPFGSELIAACHDIGKASPTFQEKIYRGCDGYIENSKEGLENVDPQLETLWGGHAGVSLAFGKQAKFGKHIAEIIGSHHGYTPDLGGRIAIDNVFGGLNWNAEREKLVSGLKEALDCDFPNVESPIHASVLAGFTTVSDWIGSGHFFQDPKDNWKDKIKAAVDGAGFVSPELNAGLSFSDIFNFEPRNIQKSLYENCSKPGVHILEAPMGSGKTEAALYAAYQAMTAGSATGVYFALPTQLTSEKIHERFESFLNKIVKEDSPHRKALLLHGNAWMKQEMAVEGNPGGSWFQGSKRGILAPFAVGTVDQALMAVMNVKHGFVRAFGLMGKVVILDEVHSYDAYTGTILGKLVDALREIGCTVIILSATLTKKRRDDFLNVVTECNDYPLISSCNDDGKLKEITEPNSTSDSVSLKFRNSDREILSEVIDRAESGEQVLWIENSVKNAQKIFSILKGRTSATSVDVGLLHSRFTALDRSKNEDDWVSIYGKYGAVDRRKCGRILIGTQVVEQSIDIDADYLVTRICPIDMLMQRIGRLWRHDETIRPATSVREVCVLSPDMKSALDAPDKVFGDTGLIYSPYVLIRSLEVISERNDISLPADIRNLLEEVYADRDEANEAIISELRKLRKTRDKLERFAQIGISSGGTTLSENKASTRFNEFETADVLLVRSIENSNRSGFFKVELLDGGQIEAPIYRNKISLKNRAKTAIEFSKYIVRVPEYQAPKSFTSRELGWLGEYIYVGNEAYGESLLRIGIVGKDANILSLNGGECNGKFELKYDNVIGFRARKITEYGT